MRSTHTRRALLVVFAAMAMTLLVSAVVWACTLPVGDTQVVYNSTTDTFQAVGEVSYVGEGISKCDDGDGAADEDCQDQDESQAAGSGYDFGIVKPSVWNNLKSSTCHYANEHSDLADPNISFEFISSAYTEAEETSAPGGEILTASVPDPSGSSADTVACFTSEEQNGQKDGGATATLPQPVVIGTGSTTH